MPLKWTRTLDGHYNRRPLYDYDAKIGEVTFSICSTTDAGFGLSVYDHANNVRLNNGHSISFLRTLGRCKAEAERIAATLEAKPAS